MAFSTSSKDFKGSKLLDKLVLLNQNRSAANKNGQEDLSPFRHVTGKYLQHVQGLDRHSRDNVLHDESTLPTLLSTLEFSDRQVQLNVLNTCLELIGKLNTNKRAVYFIPAGVQTLIFTLAREYHEASPSDDVLVAIHLLLAKIAPKDKKFSIKMRLGQGLPVLLYLLKNNTNGVKTLTPVLQILKSISANTVNASYLGKNGAITYLYKVLLACGKRRLNLQKMALESLALLLKSKSNSARAVGQGLVPYLLHQFQEWHRIDSKYRHVNLRKAILLVLKYITNLKSGRKALADADGVRILYSTCKELLDVRDMEPVVITASNIMKKCFPKCRLPLSKMELLTFPLPDSDLHIYDLFTSTSMKYESMIEDGDDSSVDNDDDISSEDEARDSGAKMASDEPWVQLREAPTRSPDDLFMYQNFFLEQFDIVLPPNYSNGNDYDIDEDDDDEPETSLYAIEKKDHNIYIPTVESESTSYISRRWSEGRTRLLRSYTQIPTRSQASFSTDLNARSQPTFLTEVNSDEEGSVNTKTDYKYDLRMFSRHNVRESHSLFLKGRTYDVLTGSSNSDLRLDTLRSRRQSDPERANRSTTQEKYSNLNIRPDIYKKIAARTLSVMSFTKIAAPDLNGHKPTPFLTPVSKRKPSVLRNKVYTDIDRLLYPHEYCERVVYDLDAQLDGNLDDSDNSRELELGNLKFNSRFESGNLRKAIQIKEYEYDLLLNPDVNTDYHHQWFYFEVSNTMKDVTYRFNLINCEKSNSQFNFGMKPVMYSEKESMMGRPYWQRVATDICYYKNHYKRTAPSSGPTTSQAVAPKTHYTASFCLKFPYSGDTCYLAYHYPYTYSTLQNDIAVLESRLDENLIYYRNEVLCSTLGGNPIPLLTITSYPKSDSKVDVEEMRNRPYMFLTARVHPGESNASWVMKGTLQFLLGDHPTALALRNTYIFKIVPMLNPDGVINGNDRCSLAGEDLNRRWYHPCPKLHPTIYHTKGLLQYMKLLGKSPLVFCDYHGHSRKKNVFIYGCSSLDSWLTDDSDNPTYIDKKTEDASYKHLPRLLHRFAPSFSLSGCNYMVEKNKESTARVVVWRQLRVVRSYTMESTFCGCQQGIYKGLQISTRELEEMGERFAEVLIKMKVKTTTTLCPEEGDDRYNRPDSGEQEKVVDSVSELPAQDGHLTETTSTSSASDDDDDDDEAYYEEDDDDDEEAQYEEYHSYRVDDDDGINGAIGAMGMGDSS